MKGKITGFAACVMALLALAACVVAPPATPVPTAASDDMGASAGVPAATDDDAADMDAGAEEGGMANFEMPAPTMTQLADGVYQYFGFFTSSLVVIAEDDVLIVDTGNGQRAQSLKDEIAKLTATPVTTIVMTHEHYDHVGGSGVFEDATVVCHVNCQPIFDLFDNPTGGDVPDVDQTFEDYMAINVGDKLVELHYLGPGDGDATTVVYMPEEQIVLTADMYEPMALSDRTVVDDKNFTGTRHILNTISQWPLKHAINSHSQGTDPVDLRTNVEYYNDLYDAVYNALADAAASGDPFATWNLISTLPQTLQLEKYQDWGNYDTAFPRHVERMLYSITHGD